MKKKVMEKEKIVVLLDNGHAKNTIGKQSPQLPQSLKDKYGIDIFKEYKYNRIIVSKLISELTNKYGIEVFDVTPEEVEDIKLTERANRANQRIDEAKKQGKKCLFISCHVNAASTNGWSNASGWSVWTTKGKTKSDDFAECLYDAAKEILEPLGERVRSDMQDKDHDYEENFTVIYKTQCPAVLIEMFFMDNQHDVDFLLSEKGMQANTDIIIKGILSYIKQI
jgi:N-acetylmuramoyl-L-alanine amidase